jgi:phage-related minor tail protein
MSAQPEPTTAPPIDADPEGDDLDPVALKAQLERERRASAQYRAGQKKAEDALKAREDADLTEAQKVAKERDDFKAQLEAERLRGKQLTVREKAKDLAYKLGIVDADVAYRLLDTEAIEYDANGEPTNLEDLLKALLAEKSYLAGKPRPSGSGEPGRRGPAQEPPDINARIRQAAGGARIA